MRKLYAAVTIRIEQSIWERLERAAEESGTTRNGFITTAIEQAIERAEAEDPRPTQPPDQEK